MAPSRERKMLRIALVFLTLGVRDGCLLAQGLDRVTLQLKWRHQFQFAGYYAAEELGFYREKGLDVVFREGASSLNYTDAVVSGIAQYGVSNTDILIDRAKGKPVVALAAIFQHSPLILLSLRSEGLDTPDAFVGKRVMVSVDAEAEIYSLFNNEGVPLSAMELVPHSWDLRDLVSGKVDAVSAYSTNELLALRRSGVDAAALRPLTYGIDFYGDCLFTSDDELRRHPGRAARFLEASLRGWDYAMDHPGEMADLILERYSPEKSREALLAEAAAMADLVDSKLVPIGFMNPGRWRHIADTYASLGTMPREYDLSSFLYDPDRPHRLNDKVLRIVFSAIIGASLVALVYILVLRSFNRALAGEVRGRTELLCDANRRLEAELARGMEREERLAASVSEKEVLLREVHHRVKNNLQVIISLINLQYGGGDADRAFLRELRNRVLGMALVHESLYSGDHMERVRMADYLERLVAEVVLSYSKPGFVVVPRIAAPGIFLAMDQALPVGLIVTELVSNSMKHAFIASRRGTVEVALRAGDGRRELIVADDGCGSPPVPPGQDESRATEAASPRGGPGLGLSLVAALAEQLRGTLSVTTGAGRRTRLVFPGPGSGEEETLTGSLFPDDDAARLP